MSAESPNVAKASKGAKRKQILLRLQDSVVKDLKKAAVDLEKSASAIAEEAITAWLLQHGHRRPEGAR